MTNFINKRRLKAFAEINAGIVLITIAYYFFLLPNKLVIGGVMGISIIIEEAIPPWIFLYTCYVILIIVGGLLLGKQFLIRSIYGAIFQPTLVLLFELLKIKPDAFMNTVLDNKLFVALFCCGVLNGIGGGLMFRNNATTGGMDVVQKIISKYLHIPMSAAIYITDAIVITLGMFFFGIEKTVFAILTMLLSGKIVDLVVTGTKNKKAMYIITDKSDEIKRLVYEVINRGVTIIDAKGGYTMQDKKLLFSIVNNREYLKIKEEIPAVDKNAFAFVIAASEVLGAGFSGGRHSKVINGIQKELEKK